MTIRHLAALSLATILLSAPLVAQAATSNHRAHHTTHHATSASRSSTRSVRAMANSDRSADSLNAQSLARARGQQ